MTKRRLLLLCFVLAFALPPVMACADGDTPAQLASKAVDEYDAGQYAEAADTYTTLTRGLGALDADAWYNAGNAYARAGRRGAAIAAYRRAIELAPRHTDARQNLALVRGQVKSGDDQTATAFVEWLLTPVQLVPLKWWRNVAGVAWVLAWLLTAAQLIKPAFPKWLIASCASLCLLAAAGWSATLLARSLESRAIVVTEDAPLRTGPGPDYLATHALPDGTECRLRTRQAGWVQLQLSDGSTGWLEADRVLLLPLGDPVPEHDSAPMSDAT